MFPILLVAQLLVNPVVICVVVGVAQLEFLRSHLPSIQLPSCHGTVFFLYLFTYSTYLEVTRISFYPVCKNINSKYKIIHTVGSNLHSYFYRRKKF